MEVVIERRKMVSPRSVTPAHLRRCTISSIDQLQFPAYLGLFLLYRPVNDSVFDPSLVRLLEESLSEALTIYYPLAGRYVEDGYYIDCGGQGVELVEAKVNGSLDQLMSLSQEPDPNLLDKLSTFPVCVKDSPLFIIQVNKLEDGGLAIGLRITHRVADLCSTIAFVDAWAKICRGSNPGEVVPPNFDVSSVLPPKSSLTNFSLPMNIGNEKLVMRKFEVSGETLARLAIETVSDESDMKLKGYLRPTRTEIMLALLCKALVKIDRAKNSGARPIAICFTINLRRRMSAKIIPETGFGNIYTVTIETVSTGDEEWDLCGYIKMVQETMRKAKARYGEVGSAEELWSMVMEDTKRVSSISTSGEHCVVTCTSGCGFPLYGIDFGWGGPEMVVSNHPPFRTNVLMDRKGDGGIDAWVVLDEEEMTMFKEDEDIVKNCLF